MKTVSITSYQMQNPHLAKVVIATTGNPTKDEIHQILAEKFNMQVTPVANSFRKLTANAAVGYLRANREIRVVEKAELRASYRVLSSNIIMDNKDKTLWEVKSGAAGEYLARCGNEDLSELVEASVYSKGQGHPKVHQLAIDKGRPAELAAFVTPNGDMDYGFVLKANSEKTLVLSASTKTQTKVDNTLIAGFYQPEIDSDTRKAVGIQLKANGFKPGDKLEMEQYYRALFSYAPDYLAEVIRIIEDTVVA